MKLVSSDWERAIHPGEGSVPILSIENESYLCETFMALYDAMQQGSTRYVLSVKGKEINMKKSFLLIGSPMDMNPNDRKLLTALYKKLRDIAYDELHLTETTELCGGLVRYINCLTMDHDLPLTYEPDIDVTELFKAFHVQVESDGETLAERMLTFMKSWVSLCGDTCFCFSHFRDFLSPEMRREFYKNAISEDLKFFLLEGVCHDIMEPEDIFIIDKDLCQIF